MDNLPKHYVYQNSVIECVTVAVQYSLFLEQSATTLRSEFIDKALKILPLLYLKTTMLPASEESPDGFTQPYVQEEEYAQIQGQIRQILEPDDSFLEVFHPEMQYSDTPILLSAAELMADIYQELKDMAGNFQTGETEVMHEAILQLKESFEGHWGAKVLNVMRALHAIKHNANV